MKKENYFAGNSFDIKNEQWKEKIETYTKPVKKTNIFHSALLVIDMQNFFLNKNSHAFVPSAKSIVNNLKNLIYIFRSRNLPVIFTKYALKKGEDSEAMRLWWRNTIKEGSNDSKMSNELKPSSSDVILRKTTYSAFYQTNLKNILVEKGIKNLFITGVMTHLCCETTAREAFIQNFCVYFVIDGTATYNEELHIASLITLSHGFVYPITTQEAIKMLNEKA